MHVNWPAIELLPIKAARRTNYSCGYSRLSLANQESAPCVDFLGARYFSIAKRKVAKIINIEIGCGRQTPTCSTHNHGPPPGLSYQNLRHGKVTREVSSPGEQCASPRVVLECLGFWYAAPGGGPWLWVVRACVQPMHGFLELKQSGLNLYPMAFWN